MLRKYLLILFWLITTTSGATHYYVKNGGNNAASGLDDANAWATIAYVNGRTFAPDDIISFKCGNTWTESVSLYPASSGTSGHPITFNSYGTGAKPILRLTSYNGIDIVNKNYITLDNLDVDGTNTTFALRFQGNSSYNRVTNCKIQNATMSGILLTGNCDFNYFGYNEVYNNGTHDPIEQDHGIYCETGNNIIEYNNCHNNTGYGIHVYTETPNNIDNNIVRYNYTHHNGAGMVIAGGNSNEAYYNIIVNNIDVGLIVGPVYTGHKIYNNTIYGNGGQGLTLSCSYSFVRNNIVYGDGIYNVGSGNTLSNNLITNPYFTNGSGTYLLETDFQLQSGSPARDAGYTVSISPDYFGNKVPYNNIADIGAHEYTVGSSDPPKADPIPPASPVYVSSAIENASPSVITMTYSLALANIIPSASAFPVMVNSSARTVTAVAVSGTKVTLTLSSPVVYGNNVTVNYNKPSSNPLQTSAGGMAESLPAAQPVSNNVSPVAPTVPVYVSSSVENASPSVIIMTYSLALANIIPSASAFLVTVNSSSRTVTAVSVSGTKVTLTLSSPVVYGNNVAVIYNKPSSNPLQTSAGGQAASLPGAQPVSNKVNPVAPAVPVYVSSAIENATPSRLEMTYSLTLTNSFPVASAFAVKVNTVARSVTAVSVYGNKVILTLASPVIYGNVVIVAYTKPATNPIKTTAGGEAASIGPQTVVNRVNYVNFPPVVVVNYTPTSLSGFVGEINASKSYDPNNDKLSYEWIAPDNVPISTSNSPIAKFLSPVVGKPTTYDFIVKISDGKITQSRTLPVEIIPYKPELQEAKILKVEASSFQYPNLPHNILDGNIGTMWAADGTEQWLLLHLNEPFKVDHVKVSFQSGMKGESYFDILGSADNVTWEPVLTKSVSCGFSWNPQVFGFPSTKAEQEYSYIKFVGQCNSINTWNYISELKLFGFGQKTLAFKEQSQIIIYPNPVNEYINISIKEQTLTPDFIRIINLSGKIVLEKIIEPEIKELQIPINLFSGVYIVQMGSGDLTLFTQKLVVSK